MWQPIETYDYNRNPLVLVARSDAKMPTVATAYLSDCGYGWRAVPGDKKIAPPTHWQPLPKPPQGETK